MVNQQLNLLRFKPQDLDQILNSYNGSKIKNLKRTIKYVYSVRDDDDFKKIVSINSNTVNINFRKLSWVVFKYLKISSELIELRNSIIHDLFDAYSTGFNEYAIEVKVKNPSNVWLDMNYKKINLLKNYCDALLSDNYFKQSVCSSVDCSVDCLPEYNRIHNMFIDVMDRERDIVRDIQKRQEREKEDVRAIRAREDSKRLLQEYKSSFNSESFLEYDESERNDENGKENNDN